jgi:hypothetical protein
VVGLHFFENKTNGEMKPLATRKEEKTIVPMSGEKTCITPANYIMRKKVFCN